MSDEFVQTAFGRLLALAQLVDSITASVKALSAPAAAAADEEAAAGLRTQPTTTAGFLSLQETPSEYLTSETVELMLDALCTALEDEVMVEITAAKEEFNSLRQRLTAMREGEQAALAAADALQEERDEAKNLVESLQKELTEQLRLKQQLTDQVADLRLESRDPAEDLKRIERLEQKLADSERQNAVLRQAHRGRNVGETRMQELLEEKAQTLAEQQMLLATQQQQLEQQRFFTRKLEAQLRTLEHEARRTPSRHPKYRRLATPHRRRPRFALEPILPKAASSRSETGAGGAGLQRKDSLLVRNLKEDLLDAERREQIRAEVVALECENDLLRRDVARLQADLADVAAGQSKVANLQAELQAKTVQLTRLKAQLLEVDSRVAGKDVQLSDLKSRCEDLYSQLQAFKSENEELRIEISGRAPPVDPHAAERQRWEQTEKELRGELEAAQNAAAAAAAAAAAVSAEDRAPSPALPPTLTAGDAFSREGAAEQQRLDHQHELEALRVKYRIRAREMQKALKEELAARAQSFTAKLMKYQEEIAQLEQRNRTMELKLDDMADAEKGDPEKRAVKGLDKLLKPLPSGEFAVTLPAATTSVKIPIERFIRHRYVIVHVTLPAQKLVIFNRGGNYRIEKSSDVDVAQPPALIDLEEIN